MSIILKENEWAKQMIASGCIGRKPSETLRRVARYYIDEGYTSGEVQEHLNTFLLRCDANVSIPKWQNMMDFAIRRATRDQAIDIEFIAISDAEMRQIDKLDGTQIRRLAFTLLCLAKYHNTVDLNSDSWVGNKDNEIMALANINTSIKRQCSMYRELRDVGMIQFSKRVDNTSVKVCFITDGTDVLHITDFRNLGYQYLMYHGKPYFECSCCGITAKISNPENNRKPKYCSECAAKIHMQQTVNSVMKCRSKMNS